MDIIKSVRALGLMSGTSLDGVDIALVKTDGIDVYDFGRAYTVPYDDSLREQIRSILGLKPDTEQNAAKISLVENLLTAFHAEVVKDFLSAEDEPVDVIGFHGHTIHHEPENHYTHQIGDGQLLADLTGIPVVYDFRSDLLMAGFDGAPLAPLHNAHIAMIEGDGCYYNGGNTSNFSIVIDGKAIIAADAGPCNEYIDAYIRRHTTELYDRDGRIGRCGRPDMSLLQYMFDCGRHYYEAPLPKSGDPAYYHTEQIFAEIAARNIKLEDAVRSLCTDQPAERYFPAIVVYLVWRRLEKSACKRSLNGFTGGEWLCFAGTSSGFSSVDGFIQKCAANQIFCLW